MIENLREIGNVLYRVGDDGMLYPVRRVRPDTAPQGVPPKSPGLLDIGNGIPERLGLLNQMFNPVEAMGQSMQAGERLLSPGVGGWDRVAAAGNMLSGVAGVVAPAVAANRLGGPAANALAETMTGMSMRPGANALREFATDDSGALKLYHGSPHDFDRFSLDKIGTGEGAQAYGHGLYFAENEGVARGYRDVLSKSGTDGAQRRLQSAGGDIDVAIAQATDKAAKYRAGGAEGYASAVEEDLRFLEKFKETGEWTPGRMYEVNVDANPEDFLDWDKPLSEQSEKVREAIKLRDFSLGSQTDMSVRGGQYHDAIQKQEVDRFWRESGGSFPASTMQDAPAKYLKGVGIPGIRYLDQGSRGAGDGSRNYVVFDENLISLVRKYGIAGAAAMLGISQADVAQAMQQQQPRGLLSMGAQ